MPDFQEPPIGRGDILDSSAGHDINTWLGAEKDFPADDFDAVGVMGKLRANVNSTVRCRLVKNNSGIVLSAKQIVVLNEDGTEIDGLVRLGTNAAGAERGYPIDEFIDSNGVGTADACWVVIRGIATVVTGVTADDENVITAGSAVIACTAAASTVTTTAGRAAGIEGATSVLALNLINAIGTAMSTMTTANTATDLLIDVGNLW